jgi:ADP-glucose pyrophosphorylase
VRSDVICEFPLKDLLAFHKKIGAEATILVTQVEDPSKYGVVVTDESGKVDRFVEKPKVRALCSSEAHGRSLCVRTSGNPHAALGLPTKHRWFLGF